MLVAGLLAAAGVAANGGQQSELVVYASGRLGSGSTVLDAALTLAALVAATALGLLGNRRWPVLLLATAPLHAVLLVAALDPPAVNGSLRTALVAIATFARVLGLLGVLGAAQDLVRRSGAVPGAVLTGAVIGCYSVGGYLQAFGVGPVLIGAGLVGGVLAGLIRRPTGGLDGADRRAALVGTIGAALALLPTLLPAISPQEQLGLTGTAFLLGTLVLGGLLGLPTLGWLLALGLVTVGVSWPLLALVSTAGGTAWLIVGLVVGAGLAVLGVRTWLACALCLLAALIAHYLDQAPAGPALAAVLATLVLAGASAAAPLTSRSALPAVGGPLLAVAVTAGSELALWAQVAWGGQTTGTVFGGSGSVLYAVPALVAAAVLIAALAVVELRQSRTG
ncbi:hypothetical protein GCM10010174_44570 [Kutzneria viridogrisea]